MAGGIEAQHDGARCKMPWRPKMAGRFKVVKRPGDGTKAGDGTNVRDGAEAQDGMEAQGDPKVQSNMKTDKQSTSTCTDNQNGEGWEHIDMCGENKYVEKSKIYGN